MRRLILLAAMAVAAACPGRAGDAAPDITRVVATLNGVFSPRGFFNITVRLYQLQGVRWAKFDLKRSQLTLDFEPGVAVTEKEIKTVMVSAGYRPGNVKVESLPASAATETGPGWVEIKHPKASNPVVRWFQLNF